MTVAKAVSIDGHVDKMRRVAAQAIREFGLPPETSVHPLRGVNNTTFDVSAPTDREPQRLVLRVHRRGYRTPAQVAAELKTLRAIHEPLRKRGVRVPSPLTTPDGRLVISVATGPADEHEDGSGYLCDLLTWVEGRVLRPGRGLRSQGVRSIGSALGELHTAFTVATCSWNPDRPRWDLDGLVSDSSNYGSGGLSRLRARLSSRDWPLVEEVVEAGVETFEVLERKGHPSGLIHGDFILLNCHLLTRREGWSVGVIDFDDAGWGVLAS